MDLSLGAVIVALGRWAMLALLLYAVILAVLNALDARGRLGRSRPQPDSEVTDIRGRRGA